MKTEHPKRTKHQPPTVRVESHSEERKSQLEKIEQGIRDADAGRVVPHSTVKRYLKSWGTRRKPTVS